MSLLESAVGAGLPRNEVRPTCGTTAGRHDTAPHRSDCSGPGELQPSVTTARQRFAVAPADDGGQGVANAEYLAVIGADLDDGRFRALFTVPCRGSATYVSPSVIRTCNSLEDGSRP